MFNRSSKKRHTVDACVEQVILYALSAGDREVLFHMTHDYDRASHVRPYAHVRECFPRLCVHADERGNEDAHERAGACARAHVFYRHAYANGNAYARDRENDGGCVHDFLA